MKLWAELGVSVAAALGAATLAAPLASASVTANPYTPAEACANDFGGSWSLASDGHREVRYGTAKWGDVYLMYNSAHANCVATIKSVDIGTKTYVDAGIKVQGGDWQDDDGQYAYYAAVKASANNLCVQYDGFVGRGSNLASGGRYTWGNCG
ncbi:hypothetical protein [Amycolatopsis rifamycinica]|uniref:Uncharacterized protein n=1 Tax=Amycolatopsis rifamycinica TaxID=287986 RepID=A0A066TXC8_9PSEU|nr:hypothetical protein [Amycolatopsis rifamycinica]KDN16559.1 hypothetical protein DV20_39230 [Amycolatopsis rifamycinica]